MRLNITLILVLLSFCINAQYSFYSNDLSEKDIERLVNDRDDWKEKAIKYERLLDEFKRIPKTPDYSEELANKSSELIRVKSQLNGLKSYSEFQLSQLRNQIANLKSDLIKSKKQNQSLQNKIEDLVEKEKELSKTIADQGEIIDNLQSEITQLRGVIDDKNLEIQARKFELIKGKLSITEIGTDLFAKPKKNKSEFISVKKSNDAIRLKYIKKNRGVYFGTTYFRLSDEMKTKKFPKAKVFIYNTNEVQPIIRTSVDLNKTIIPSKMVRNPYGEDFQNEIQQGVVFYIEPKLFKISKSKMKKVSKGNYYYLVIIDESVSTIGFFEVI